MFNRISIKPDNGMGADLTDKDVVAMLKILAGKPIHRVEDVLYSVLLHIAEDSIVQEAPQTPLK